MSKKILLIESDNAFAKDMARALEDRGFQSRVTGDGKEGLDLARDERPDAIVLCVELPKMSGYSICNKLKKDEDLKAIPLVIMSAEATPETFEQHKKLKTRAEEYLIKPFAPNALIEKLGNLVGMPEPGDEDVVNLDVEDATLDALSGDIAPLDDSESTLLDTGSDANGASPETLEEVDADLKLLDDAFGEFSADGDAAPIESPLDLDGAASLGASDSLDDGEPLPPIPTEGPVADDDLDAAMSSLDRDEPPALGALEGIGDDADLALAALGDELTSEPSSPPPTPDGFDADHIGVASPGSGGADSLSEVSGVHGVAVYMARVAELEEKLAQQTAEVEQLKSTRGSAPSGSKEVLTLKSAINQKDKEILRIKQDLNLKETELLGVKEKENELETQMESLGEEVKKRDSELKVQKGKLEGFVVATKKLETELKGAREEARKATDRSADASQALETAKERGEELERTLSEKTAESADAAGKIEALEKEMSELRGELESSRTEGEQARFAFEASRREAGELQRKISDLEQSNTKNEERVVKAYQKIKGDEKVREKTKKALAIALQLLEEHAQGGEGEKDVRP